jgi:hypothetical protein
MKKKVSKCKTLKEFCFQICNKKGIVKYFFSKISVADARQQAWEFYNSQTLRFKANHFVQPDLATVKYIRLNNVELGVI